MTEQERKQLEAERRMTATYLNSNDPKNVQIAQQQIDAIDAKLNPPKKQEELFPLIPSPKRKK